MVPSAAPEKVTRVPLAVSIHLDSALAGVLIGAAVALLGQVIAHRYAQKRDERREIVEGVDRVIAALVAIDRRASNLLTDVAVGKSPQEVQASADLVTDCEEANRAALVSLSIRLRRGGDLITELSAAESAYSAACATPDPVEAKRLLGEARRLRASAVEHLSERFRTLR